MTRWYLGWLVCFAAVAWLWVGCDGSLNVGDDDAVGDDDDVTEGDDDDVAGDDDDVTEGDDDDDVTEGDDDDVVDDDDDVADDDDDACPWDGGYAGEARISFVSMGGEMWAVECEIWACIEQCLVAGEMTCPSPDPGGVIALDLEGGVNPIGPAAGDLAGNVGNMGYLNVPWEGHLSGALFEGSFHDAMPMIEVMGEWLMEHHGPC